MKTFMEIHEENRKRIEEFNREQDKKWIADTFNKIDDIETFLGCHLIERSFAMSTFTDDDRKVLASMSTELSFIKDLVYDHFVNKYGKEEADKYIFEEC